MDKSGRRKFIKDAVLASSAAALSPLMLPSCSNWKGANDRLNIGHIGVGSRGWLEIKKYFLPLEATRSVAVCDVRKSRIEQASQYINQYYQNEKGEKGFQCEAYENFEELLDRSDIDAVHIVTGDYWHLHMAIKAMRAGKHVYLAKPLGLSYPLMQILTEEQQKSGLVFQYGTQQRSFDHITTGINMIREGLLGKIDRIEVWSPEKSGEQLIQKPDEVTPAGFNYDKWLGPAPLKPYSEARCSVRGTWFIYDYSLGWIAGWGAHPLDIAVMGAKSEMSGSYTLSGTGSLWAGKGLFDTLVSWDTQLKYDDGLNIRYLSADLAKSTIQKYREYDATDGTTFFGEKGWISLTRWTARASDPGLNKKLNRFPKDDRGRIKSENHMHGANFAKVIKGEMAPFDPLDEAIMSDCISHMGNLSIRCGKDVKWNPEKGQVTNLPEMNRLFDRTKRSPWDQL
ncbi:MAG: Gfo/Idh/MocA family oxidoreductase [Bacteroidetes bacterium]|nr:Gfo/Idh/MocA family oxidoreductase [Bacteroidota bacterium]